MAEIIELRKGLNISGESKGSGVSKTFAVLHKMPRYLFLYYKISFGRFRVEGKGYTFVSSAQMDVCTLICIILVTYPTKMGIKSAPYLH